MAEQFFLLLAREADFPCTASSAGTQAEIGMPLSRGAAAVFAARGIVPVTHLARLVDGAILAAADSVYVMERSHLDDLVFRFPESAAKIAVLREAAGLSPFDLKDPLGGSSSISEYQTCAHSLEAALRIIVATEKKFHAPNPR